MILVCDIAAPGREARCRADELEGRAGSVILRSARIFGETVAASSQGRREAEEGPPAGRSLDWKKPTKKEREKKRESGRRCLV